MLFSWDFERLARGGVFKQQNWGGVRSTTRSPTVDPLGRRPPGFKIVIVSVHEQAIVPFSAQRDPDGTAQETAHQKWSADPRETDKRNWTRAAPYNRLDEVFRGLGRWLATSRLSLIAAFRSRRCVDQSTRHIVRSRGQLSTHWTHIFFHRLATAFFRV